MRFPAINLLQQQISIEVLILLYIYTEKYYTYLMLYKNIITMTYYTCRREGMCCSSAFISIQAIWMFVVGAYVAYYYIHFTIGYFEFWKGAEVLEDSGSIIHIIYILKPTYFDYLFYYDSAICIIIVDSAITKIRKESSY